eukprot:79993-Pyramimonas_sp.AAC.1
MPLSATRCRAWHCLAMLGIGSPSVALLGIELSAPAWHLSVVLDTGWPCSAFGVRALHCLALP